MYNVKLTSGVGRFERFHKKKKKKEEVDRIIRG